MDKEYTAEYFKKRYGQVLERPYESFQYHSKDFHNEFSFLKPQKEERVLDIGCGLGNMTWALAKRVRICIGLDISKYAIQKAKSFYHSDNLKFIIADATTNNLPFKDQSFDIVVCSEIYEHLNVHQGERLLANVKKVLRDHGRLLFIVPVNEKMILSFKRLIFKILRKGEVQYDWTHKRSLDLEEIFDDLGKKGFRDIKWRARSHRGKLIDMLVKSISRIPVIGKRLIESVMLIAFKKEHRGNFC